MTPTTTESHNQIRAQIEAHVAEYLARGGKIEQVAPDVNAITTKRGRFNSPQLVRDDV